MATGRGSTVATTGGGFGGRAMATTVIGCRTGGHLIEGLLAGLLLLAKEKHQGDGYHHHHIEAKEAHHHFIRATGRRCAFCFGFLLFRVCHGGTPP
jgi:hypothetical protein